jgi:RFX DNA-binding domain
LFSDPIGVFFTEATEQDSEGKVPKEQVYTAYRRFCKHYRLPVESYDHFCKLVKKKFPLEVAEGRDSAEGRKRVWKGFALIKWNFADSMQDILTP